MRNKLTPYFWTEARTLQRPQLQAQDHKNRGGMKESGASHGPLGPPVSPLASPSLHRPAVQPAGKHPVQCASCELLPAKPVPLPAGPGQKATATCQKHLSTWGRLGPQRPPGLSWTWREEIEAKEEQCVAQGHIATGAEPTPDEALGAAPGVEFRSAH